MFLVFFTNSLFSWSCADSVIGINFKTDIKLNFFPLRFIYFWTRAQFVHSENKIPEVSTKVHLKPTTAEQAGGRVTARASSGSGLLKFTDQVTVE